MDVAYTRSNPYRLHAADETVTLSLAQFVTDHVIYTGDVFRLKRISLEDQPLEVCKLVGRLIDVLAEKGVLQFADIEEVLGHVSYHYRDFRKADG